jgi:predicted small secreted protein
MFRFVGLVALVVLTAAVFAACGSSDGAPEPVVSAVNPTSEAGSLAISSVAIEAESCKGVLPDREAENEGDISLFRDSLTDSVTSSQPQIVSMCSAMYDTNLPGREFLAVVLIQFKSDDSAVDHYELMKGAYFGTGDGISEINNADESLTDVLSVLIDEDGIGRTMVMRQREWLVTVTAGPTMADSPWNVGDIEMIGNSVLERVN